MRKSEGSKTGYSERHEEKSLPSEPNCKEFDDQLGYSMT
jgi:hypothetical protein